MDGGLRFVCHGDIRDLVIGVNIIGMFDGQLVDDPLGDPIFFGPCWLPLMAVITYPLLKQLMV